MSRSRHPLPSYLPHRQSGRARAVWTDPTGTRQFRMLPGAYDSTESRAAFATLLLELEAFPHRGRLSDPDGITINEVLLAYTGVHASSLTPALRSPRRPRCSTPRSSWRGGSITPTASGTSTTCSRPRCGRTAPKGGAVHREVRYPAAAAAGPPRRGDGRVRRVRQRDPAHAETARRPDLRAPSRGREPHREMGGRGESATQ